MSSSDSWERLDHEPFEEPRRWERWECLVCDYRQTEANGQTLEEHCATRLHRCNEARRLIKLHQTALLKGKEGVAISFESGGAEENPIQAVPNGKVKSSMKISNKGDMRVALKELDLLFPVQGLAFERLGGEESTIGPNQEVTYAISYTPGAIGILEAIFVAKCEGTLTDGDFGKAFSIGAKFVCHTAHPKYNDEIVGLINKSMNSPVRKTVRKTSEREMEYFRNAGLQQRSSSHNKDLQNLDFATIDLGLSEGGYKVPGEYKRLAASSLSSQSNEEVRFEMLEGLQHPRGTQDGLKSAQKGTCSQPSNHLANYNDYWHRVLWIEEVCKDQFVRKRNLTGVYLQVLGPPEEDGKISVKVQSPASKEDSNLFKGVHRAAIVDSEGNTCMAPLADAGSDFILLKVPMDFGTEGLLT